MAMDPVELGPQKDCAGEASSNRELQAHPLVRELPDTNEKAAA